MKKTKDIIVSYDDRFYASFPSIVKRPDGELLCAFRRAPDRRPFGGSWAHWDPVAQAVLLRSKDHGETWSSEPELIHAHPLGGNQDPCLIQLQDQSLLVTNYLHVLIPREQFEDGPYSDGQCNGWKSTFAGGYVMKSEDNAQSWHGPYEPPPVQDWKQTNFEGLQIPRFNRGAPCPASDGKIYWAAAKNTKQTCLQLLVSSEGGRSWDIGSDIVSDEKVGFSETSMIETAAGDLVTFSRTAKNGDRGVVTRSRNKGQTWERWQDTGIVGHPYHAIRLEDDRILLVYGYRHKPYGIRARVLDPDATDFEGEEIILRDDGGMGDLGYPWATLTGDGRVLVVYYFQIEDGVRHIAGTYLEA